MHVLSSVIRIGTPDDLLGIFFADPMCQSVRRGLKPIPPKAVISLRVDADVLDWFKAQGPGYQTRINALLRAYKEEAA
jgi:uncharacterized protein (DUF4415 family)